jgi:hypothetical protein
VRGALGGTVNDIVLTVITNGLRGVRAAAGRHRGPRGAPGRHPGADGRGQGQQFSYDGQLYFGVTGDRDHAPDIDVLTAGIESGAAELSARAEPLPPPRPIRGPVAHRPLREHGHRVTSPELRQARLVRRSRCARWGDGSG